MYFKSQSCFQTWLFTSKSINYKSKKSSGDTLLTPSPRVSRVIWMAPNQRTIFDLILAMTELLDYLISTTLGPSLTLSPFHNGLPQTIYFILLSVCLLWGKSQNNSSWTKSGLPLGLFLFFFDLATLDQINKCWQPRNICKLSTQRHIKKDGNPVWLIRILRIEVTRFSIFHHRMRKKKKLNIFNYLKVNTSWKS